MTSHLISYFGRRADAQASRAPTTRAEEFLGPEGARGEECRDCTFCRIIKGEIPAFKVYEDEHTLAFLDILPIREGHTLVIPKQHFARISHMSDEASAAVGAALPRITVDHPDYNLVSNQGYAQVVYHVHYHIVPAPKLHALTYTQAKSGWSSTFSRDELDEDEGEETARRIREELGKEQRGELSGPGGHFVQPARTESPGNGKL
ncbi:hypothetical protein OIO90_003594 [Microbotryomycetes sp. JL221]|nr:hypothetical protein OIO90_003594 [Microbotryomycetes sp. JL221]